MFKIKLYLYKNQIQNSLFFIVVTWNEFVITATSFSKTILITWIISAFISKWLFTIICSSLTVYNNLSKVSTKPFLRWIIFIEFLLKNIIIFFGCTLWKDHICLINILSFTHGYIIEHIFIVTLNLIKMQFIIQQIN